MPLRLLEKVVRGPFSEARRPKHIRSNNLGILPSGNYVRRRLACRAVDAQALDAQTGRQRTEGAQKFPPTGQHSTDRLGSQFCLQEYTKKILMFGSICIRFLSICWRYKKSTLYLLSFSTVFLVFCFSIWICSREIKYVVYKSLYVCMPRRAVFMKTVN